MDTRRSSRLEGKHVAVPSPPHSEDENPRKKGKGRKPKAPPAPALEADASDVADEASLKKRKVKPKSKTKAHGAAKKPHVKSTSASKTTSPGRRSGKSHRTADINGAEDDNGTSSEYEQQEPVDTDLDPDLVPESPLPQKGEEKTLMALASKFSQLAERTVDHLASFQRRLNAQSSNHIAPNVAALGTPSPAQNWASKGASGTRRPPPPRISHSNPSTPAQEAGGDACDSHEAVRGRALVDELFPSSPARSLLFSSPGPDFTQEGNAMGDENAPHTLHLQRTRSPPPLRPSGKRQRSMDADYERVPPLSDEDDAESATARPLKRARPPPPRPAARTRHHMIEHSPVSDAEHDQQLPAPAPKKSRPAPASAHAPLACPAPTADPAQVDGQQEVVDPAYKKGKPSLSDLAKIEEFKAELLQFCASIGRRPSSVLKAMDLGVGVQKALTGWNYFVLLESLKSDPKRPDFMSRCSEAYRSILEGQTNDQVADHIAAWKQELAAEGKLPEDDDSAFTRMNDLLDQQKDRCNFLSVSDDTLLISMVISLDDVASQLNSIVTSSDLIRAVIKNHAVELKNVTSTIAATYKTLKERVMSPSDVDLSNVIPHIEDDPSLSGTNPQPIVPRATGVKGQHAKSQWPDAGDLRLRDAEFPYGKFWETQEGSRTSVRDKNRRIFRVKNTTAAAVAADVPSFVNFWQDFLKILISKRIRCRDWDINAGIPGIDFITTRDLFKSGVGVPEATTNTIAAAWVKGENGYGSHPFYEPWDKEDRSLHSSRDRDRWLDVGLVYSWDSVKGEEVLRATVRSSFSAVQEVAHAVAREQAANEPPLFRSRVAGQVARSLVDPRVASRMAPVSSSGGSRSTAPQVTAFAPSTLPSVQRMPPPLPKKADAPVLAAPPISHAPNATQAERIDAALQALRKPLARKSEGPDVRRSSPDALPRPPAKMHIAPDPARKTHLQQHRGAPREGPAFSHTPLPAAPHPQRCTNAAASSSRTPIPSSSQTSPSYYPLASLSQGLLAVPPAAAHPYYEPSHVPSMDNYDDDDYDEGEEY